MCAHLTVHMRERARVCLACVGEYVRVPVCLCVWVRMCVCVREREREQCASLFQQEVEIIYSAAAAGEVLRQRCFSFSFVPPFLATIKKWKNAAVGLCKKAWSKFRLIWVGFQHQNRTHKITDLLLLFTRLQSCFYLSLSLTLLNTFRQDVLDQILSLIKLFYSGFIPLL